MSQVVITKSVYTAKELFSDADVVVDSAVDLDFTKARQGSAPEHWEDVAALLPVLELA